MGSDNCCELDRGNLNLVWWQFHLGHSIFIPQFVFSRILYFNYFRSNSKLYLFDLITVNVYKDHKGINHAPSKYLPKGLVNSLKLKFLSIFSS